jgi:hypothetical protein
MMTAFFSQRPVRKWHSTSFSSGDCRARGLKALKTRFSDATMAGFNPAIPATHLECGIPALMT